MHVLMTNSSIICRQCGHASRTEGHSDNTLSISINDNKILKGDVIRYCHAYFSGEVECYKCEKCLSEAKKTRTLFLAHSPDLLIVHLKRFEYNKYGGLSKISTSVPVNTTLDLDKFREPTNLDSSKYALTAVVKHKGTISSGHYVCYAIGPDGDWVYYNDEDAFRSSLNEAIRNNQFQPYLLFYRRIAAN